MAGEQQIKVGDLWFSPLLSIEQIQEQVSAMGRALRAKYQGTNPLLVGVLNGCFLFMADLVRAMDIPCEIAFLRIRSYDGLQSDDQPELLIPSDCQFAGRTVLLVEDIVDTGRTLTFLREVLRKSQAQSVTTVALLYKPKALQIGEGPEYACFTIGNSFVVGYGLDYQGQGRQLQAIYALAE